MRQLLTIFHYELLMQAKAARFKALCALAALIAFGYYSDGVRQQLMPKYGQTILDYPAIVFYLVLATFTGLFSIGRIRSSGMHPVLMTKPFPTFALLLGQLLAALAAIMVPLAILFFPGGLLLRWQYGLDFQPLPVLHVILFLLIPLFCTVLAVTIWLRTCFKNNLIALIILVMIFAVFVIFADKLLTTKSGPEGTAVHRFVPMLSYFSETYWRGRMRIFDLPQVRFTNREEWINWVTSILYCNVFLMLGGYHLRRTEPQRRVLGSYGRHWYHTPTFLKMACDLKIDPNVTWYHHLILLSMIGVIVARTVWPMVPPDFAGRAFAAAAATSSMAANDPYSEDRIPAAKILAIRIHEDRQTWTRDRYVSELTVSAQGETSGTLAILNIFTRWEFDIRAVTLDGQALKVIPRGVQHYIDDRRLDLLRGGARHKMRIEAVRSSVRQEDSANRSLLDVSLRGYAFVLGKKTWGSTEQKAVYDMHIRDPWPIHLELLQPASSQFIDSPVAPGTRREGKDIRYTFDVPAERNGYGLIVFAPFHDYEIITSPNERLKFSMAVPRADLPIARELMELMQPELEEFYELHAIRPAAPIVFISPTHHMEYTSTRGNPPEKLLYDIQRYLKIFRISKRGINSWEKMVTLELLRSFETAVLKRVLSGGGEWGDKWDFSAFINRNITRGLNHRLNMDRNYQPPEFLPGNNGHMNPEGANALAGHTRTECIAMKGNWPVFRMLYLVLGHEKWRELRVRLQGETNADALTDEMIQKAAEDVAGEPLAWFFDYWLRDGMDLPCYKIESATGRQTPLDDDGNSKYEFKAVVRNIGTGRMPVPLRLRTTRDPIEEKVWIGPGETVTWTVLSRDLPKEVQVDPDGWILTKPYRSEQGGNWIQTASATVKMEIE